MSEVENVIIVGSGPAGYTAALYTARANLHPLVLEGIAWGGLLQQTTDVENYPGFPDGVMGPEMMQKFRDQAERFGARLLTDDASRVQLASEPGGVHSVWVGDTEHRARTVILAMGAEHKKLCIPGEEELGGRGGSYCATCDAAFIAIGHEPQSHLVRGQVDLDENDYVLTDGASTRTSRPGVFAAGDLVDHTYRQAVTAAGTGCQAALDAEWYLRDTPEVPTPEGMPVGDLAQAQWFHAESAS